MKRWLLFACLIFSLTNLSAQNVVEADGLGRDGKYEVGDYYNRNGREGVVFEVDATGLHGKIVSLKKSDEPLQSCTFEGYHSNLHGPIGETSESDGVFNVIHIQKLFKDWEKMFPAFAWCASLGDGWYLPAKDELVKFMEDDSVREKVEQTLKSRGEPLFYGGANQYWSSTQYSKYQGVSWFYCEGGNFAVLHKYYALSVRAVAAF